MKSAEEVIAETGLSDWQISDNLRLHIIDAMKEYASEVAQDALNRAAKRKEHSAFGRNLIKDTEIILP